jgi:hypothetical protein
MNTVQKISNHNTAVIKGLIEQFQSEQSLSTILNDFSARHKELVIILSEIPYDALINMEGLIAELENIFEVHPFSPEIKRVFSLICLQLISIKYTVLTEQKVNEFGRFKRIIPQQKKILETWAKYKREQRSPIKIKGQGWFTAVFSSFSPKILKKANSLLNKKANEEGYNLAMLSRLLFELTKMNSQIKSSDNKIILSLFDLFRQMYPENTWLSSEEEWFAAPAELAIGLDFQEYQIKTIKSMIYYSNKTIFKEGAEEDDFMNILQLVNASLK